MKSAKSIPLAKNKNICPKCKSSHWEVWASDGLPNNSMRCKDCGYTGTIPIKDNNGK